MNLNRREKLDVGSLNRVLAVFAVTGGLASKDVGQALITAPQPGEAESGGYISRIAIMFLGFQASPLKVLEKYIAWDSS